MEIANFGVEEWLNVWEKRAKFDIAQSSIEALTVAELIGLDGSSVADYFDARSEMLLDYGWIEGSDDFKREVAKIYRTLGPENILQTNGATGANLLALYALIKPGDHVISTVPSYQQLYDIPRSLGADVTLIRLREEDEWGLNLGELARAIRPDTKMITLNSANNPTGALLDRKTLLEVVEIVKTSGAYVLVDEVYAPLADDGEFWSIADLCDRGIATNSLSKTYSVPGIRIGWTAASEELTDDFRKYRDYTMICGGVLQDEMAVHALRNRDKILARNRAIVARNHKILLDWVDSEPRVSLVAPNYVSTSFIKFDIPIDDHTFCVNLLEDTGVLLVPGSAFDVPGHARVGYCCSEDVLIQGLARLSQYLRRFD